MPITLGSHTYINNMIRASFEEASYISLTPEDPELPTFTLQRYEELRNEASVMEDSSVIRRGIF
ncbi:hypothetical protein OCU04_000129 [Sclerotinia nivalis]|uniref:Uncharacterized protein n=1 Tax=Sclerotinia nivalis TaxID=352851 RepID=A0A9X0AVG9_9HELO|nr:hypothetical protein OCU04_000129 [Sclerotinia nivalis]